HARRLLGQGPGQVDAFVADDMAPEGRQDDPRDALGLRPRRVLARLPHRVNEFTPAVVAGRSVAVRGGDHRFRARERGAVRGQGGHLYGSSPSPGPRDGHARVPRPGRAGAAGACGTRYGGYCGQPAISLRLSPPLISMRRGLACSATGMRTVRTPASYVAS